MKIYSWNVNGIRAMLGKGFMQWFRDESPDILCLQETKANVDQLDGDIVNPAGYYAGWNSAEVSVTSRLKIFGLVFEPPLARRVRIGIASCFSSKLEKSMLGQENESPRNPRTLAGLLPMTVTGISRRYGPKFS